MCAPASLVVTKDKVFWSAKSDSHEEIIREFGLCDEVANRITLVRVEITPPNGDMSRPLDEWQYRVDEANPSYLPEWFVKNESKHEGRAKDALKKWFECKVVVSGHRDVRDQEVYAYDNSTVTAYGTSTVAAYDNSTVTACNNSTVTAYDNSTVAAYGTSTVIAHGYKEVKLESGLAVLVDRSKYGKVSTKKARE